MPETPARKRYPIIPLHQKEAEQIAGTLSHPDKMPCPAYSISAAHCKRGAVLRKIDGSACSKCYAWRNNYLRENVRKAMEKRYQGMVHNPQWVNAMVTQIWNSGTAYFRWFDSGDLQSLDNLRDIVLIAKRLPKVKFWLPTQEQKFVRQFLREAAFPPNLTVRVSGIMLEGPPPVGFKHTSTISSDPQRITCPAHEQGNKCLDCRACWDKRVKNVIYRRH